MKFSYFSLNMLNVISWFSNINLALNLGLRIAWHICQDPYVCDGELSFSCTVIDLGRNVNTHFKMNLEVFSPFAYAVCVHFLSISPNFWGNGSVESLVLLMFLTERFKNYKFKFFNKYKLLMFSVSPNVSFLRCFLKWIFTPICLTCWIYWQSFIVSFYPFHDGSLFDGNPIWVQNSSFFLYVLLDQGD